MNPSIRTTKFKSALLAMVLAGVASSGLAQEGARGVQNSLSRWIEVEKQISEDQSDWLGQKATLNSSIALMQGEIERLNEALETAQATASAGERKRAELEERRSVLDSAMESMRTAIEGYEQSIRELSAAWPSVFLKQVDTPLRRMPSPEQAAAAPLSMRLQNVVVILSQFDKFQGMVTKDVGVQEVDGTPREVTTLYFGTAYAYFADASGQFAGYGHPGPQGPWVWTSDASIGREIGTMIAAYDRNAEASFIGLPAKIVTP